MSNLISVTCSGIGSEFCQGVLTSDMFDMWLKFQSKHSDPNWNTFCQEELQVDGYWEVNEIGHFTALDLNHCVIKIHVNGNLFFEGSYTELRNTYEDDDVLDSNFTNESSEYGRLFLPEDIDYQSWIEKRIKNVVNENKDNNDILATVKTSESFHVKSEISSSEPFDILRFGLIGVCTDEIGFGIDYGDFLLGFKINNTSCHFEYPGGIGPIEGLYFL